MRRWAGRGSYLKWLVPGMGVKRWLLLLTAGLLLTGLGLAGLVEIFVPFSADQVVASLRPLGFNGWLPVTLVFLIGGGIVFLALMGFNRSLLSAFRLSGQEDVVEVVYRHRQRRRGPKIVAIGGGHGLSTLLRGLKAYTDNITAIVTVADDGGSSGRLRRDLGMLPPGDFRNCIAALSDAEGLVTELFQYRFGDDSGLGGHSFGNLYLMAMAAITGSFESALSESSRVLAVRGRVIPSTLSHVNLCAEVWVPYDPERSEGSEGAAAEEIVSVPAQLSGGLPLLRSAAVVMTAGARWRRVCGESQIPTAGGRVQRVYLEPEDPPAYPEAIRAVLEADLIIAGPGSLYTSVLPNLLVPDLAHAIRAARAPAIYVCNVATQPGETDSYDTTAHVQALREHIGADLFRTVLANNKFRQDRPPGGGADFVGLPAPATPPDYRLVAADLVDGTYPWRHDPDKLAQAVLEFVNT